MTRMPSMTRYDPGDVVLVRFPFTDLSSSKKRPALVLNPSKFTANHGDVVVLALTSQPQGDKSLQLRHWQKAGLPKPTLDKTRRWNLGGLLSDTPPGCLGRR